MTRIGDGSGPAREDRDTCLETADGSDMVSRDRIKGNIPISRRQLPRSSAKPPIGLQRRGCDQWVYGVDLADPSKIYYEHGRKPHSIWIDTTDNVAKIDSTIDAPYKNKDLLYLYIQLQFLKKGKRPPLTVHLYRCENAKWDWRSFCSWQMNIVGPCRIFSSLGCPLPWTADDDTGARVWIETVGPVLSDGKGWFTARDNGSIGIWQFQPRQQMAVA